MSGRLAAFAAGGAIVAGAFVFNRLYFKNTTSLPLTDSTSADNRPKVSWSDNSKYTKSPSFATGDTAFAFGPYSRFFFVCSIPHDGNEATHCTGFTSTHSSLASDLATNVQKVYSVAFSPHGDELTTFRDTTNTLQWKMTFDTQRHPHAPAYSSLLRWMREHIKQDESSFLNSTVVFGPGASYFAKTTNACHWHDIPSKLEKVLLEKQQACLEPGDHDSPTEKNAWIPRIVALGANQTYVAIWSDGRCISNLSPDITLAKEIDTEISSIPVSCWDNIVLSPHNADNYFSVTKLGHVDWNVSANGVDDLTVLAYRYMQARAKRDGLTYEMSRTVNGRTGTIEITPESGWTEETLEETVKGGSSTVQMWYQKLKSVFVP